MTTTPYCSADDLLAWVGGGSSQNEIGRLTLAATAATIRINNICGRSFAKDTVASARTYYATDYRTVEVGDIADLTGLVVATDMDGDGLYTSTISTPNYTLEPVDGVNNGTEGWPYTRIRLPFTAAGAWFPTYGWLGVQVTAKWGWPTVPEPVQLACLLIAAELWKRKEAPFGVAGFGDYGVLRIKADPDVMELLNPYRTMVYGVA